MIRFTGFAIVLSLYLLGSLALAGNATEMWREYLRQSAVCVAGKWTSVVAESDEAGVNYYQCHLAVEQAIAGDCAEKNISLSFVRIETKAEELPFLKEGERCIVFLKRGRTKEDAPYLLASTKWGLQPFSEELARQIGDAQEGRKTAEIGKTDVGGGDAGPV